ncbi:Teichoic acid translocation permease protein TagG [Sodalis glossinidius str. 'morsitans']|uniref:Transport permease protein n=1 Tax=Sodalis glossinidius (strain morsitans) TaxID=343509 RepID=Q2NTY4_SODGM|nr:ABC transporter permease [Sodalis glossinidius]BAE74391.1 ABC transporter permease component [Sodalis glossinidius str. 'morsitans']CRL45013.1 Teichoic acid translocation permease protein TagG [Sodalis glossinidius str. 'morsitans']
MLNSLLDCVLRYRGFIADSIKRDFQSRYQSSFLGALWLILQPVAIIVVYTVIFAELMRTRLADMHGPFAYSIFLCSGILTWGLFTETLNNLVRVFITHANILKKLSFPRICLPIIIVCSAMINFCIIFSLFMIFLIVSGNFPGWIILEMIPVLIIQMTFTIGLGIILGVMNVFVRDIEQFVSILLQFWFWFTPIVYVSKTLPESVRGLLKLNPMTSIITSYQNIFLYHSSPDWWVLLPVAVISLLLIVMGWRMFKKHSADIVDEL